MRGRDRGRQQVCAAAAAADFTVLDGKKRRIDGRDVSLTEELRRMYEYVTELDN